jgi:hypothetical protein
MVDVGEASFSSFFVESDTAEKLMTGCGVVASKTGFLFGSTGTTVALCARLISCDADAPSSVVEVCSLVWIAGTEGFNCMDPAGVCFGN